MKVWRHPPYYTREFHNHTLYSLLLLSLNPVLLVVEVGEGGHSWYPRDCSNHVDWPRNSPVSLPILLASVYLLEKGGEYEHLLGNLLLHSQYLASHGSPVKELYMLV